jgi:DNA-binding winged helix-turn-helix (wHTH) protein
VRIRFGEFSFDQDAMLLLRGKREVRLSKKAFELLRILIAEKHRVVKKAELHSRLWPDTFVVDTNLNVLIAEIRKALDDGERRIVRTSHGVGYRFAVDVESLDAEIPATANARSWLVVDEQRYVLPSGALTIGRDPECDVWLDAPGVSRRHARVQTSANGDVTLEDSGSTNGTYVRKAKISGPTRLRDGDEIHMGSLAITFRTAARPKQTERVRPPRGSDDVDSSLYEIAKRVRDRSDCLFALFISSNRDAIDRAASILADESGHRLQRIDLRALMSKWVGETEKNLSRLFADAERSEAILFFDEADDLFGGDRGKEGAVDGGRVLSFLLERAEQFVGLTLLVVAETAAVDDRTRKRADYILR